MELRLWKSAGLAPNKTSAWYRDLGQGMGPTLNVAAGLNAYTLTDRATWANFKNRQDQFSPKETRPCSTPTAASWSIPPSGRM
jgi:ABC-type tungstate transport system permease subunit